MSWANIGSRSRLPTHVHCQDRSAIAVSAPSSRSWPLSSVTAATHSSSPPAAVPVTGSAASTAGRATATRSAGNRYSSSSRSRVQALVVTTAAAADRTARSRLRVPSASSKGRRPSGMCTSTTSRNRAASGTSTSGAVEATSPSSSTTVPSGIVRTAPVSAANAAALGCGHGPGTACSWTDQPSDASPRQTRRS